MCAIRLPISLIEDGVSPLPVHRIGGWVGIVRRNGVLGECVTKPSPLGSPARGSGWGHIVRGNHSSIQQTAGGWACWESLIAVVCVTFHTGLSRWRVEFVYHRAWLLDFQEVSP